jgi:hypothetical protein
VHVLQLSFDNRVRVRPVVNGQIATSSISLERIPHHLCRVGTNELRFGRDHLQQVAIARVDILEEMNGEQGPIAAVGGPKPAAQSLLRLFECFRRRIPADIACEMHVGEFKGRIVFARTHRNDGRSPVATETDLDRALLSRLLEPRSELERPLSLLPRHFVCASGVRQGQGEHRRHYRDELSHPRSLELCPVRKARSFPDQWGGFSSVNVTADGVPYAFPPTVVAIVTVKMSTWPLTRVGTVVQVNVDVVFVEVLDVVPVAKVVPVESAIVQVVVAVVVPVRPLTVPVNWIDVIPESTIGSGLRLEEA